jgi:AcrR family transcriptional regulator
MTAPQRKRRTQVARSAETRQLLVSTTIECLSELGYARTTSAEIASRAGLSRGAQLHHFGSKQQMVIAAMDHLYHIYVAEFRAALDNLPAGEDPASGAIQAVWDIMNGPMGHAYLELVATARVEEEFRQPLQDLVARMDSGVDTIFREYFDAAPGTEQMFELVWTAVFSLVEGLVIESIVRPGDPKVEMVIAMVKQFAPMAIQAKP